jgi:F-box protein 21
MRSTIDAAATEYLNNVISCQRGRIKKIQDIIDFGYDVKDTLVRHSLAEPGLDDHLARR